MTRGVAAYTFRLLLRSPGRSLALIGGLSLGVALVVSILFFVESSSKQLTQTAIAPVPIDMVGHATVPTISQRQVVGAFRRQPGIQAVEVMDAVDFTTAARPGGAQKTPAGKLVAVDPSFFQSFDVLKVSSGAFDPNGALVTEATATRLGVKPGDTIAVSIPALAAPYQVKVTGIVDASRAQMLFLSTDPSKQGEYQVVTDMVVMDRSLFNRALRTALLGAASAQPAPNATGGAPVVDQQQLIRIDRTALPGSPAAAQTRVKTLARSLERQFTGQIKITNNLGDALGSAKGDALTAKILFIFLGLPGVALAVFLARYAGELYGEAQRREIGLLRARGASSRQVLGIAGLAAGVLGVAGAAVGLGAGTLVTVLARGNNALASASAGTFIGMVPWALAAGLLMAVASSFMPAWNAARQNVIDERRRIKRVERAPFWKRAWLDVGALLAAGVVLFLLNLSGGFKPAGGEGQTLSFSFYLFLAPLLLWIGLTLLLQRLLVKVIPLFARSAAGASSGFGQVAARSMGWRANRLTSAISVVALTLSFGVSLALFTSTYNAQKRMDAHYAVGSDVRVTPALGLAQPAGLRQRLLVPGATGVTAVMRDGSAVVGSERHVVYGINAAKFGSISYLPDSFLVGESATTMLSNLRATPNGVLISRDLANTFSILVGDPVLVRLSTGGGAYKDVRLKAVGIFKQFPTSSQDSDLVMNRAFMAQARGTTAADFYLVRADGTQAGATRVANEIKPLFGSTAPAQVQDLTATLATDQSTLTSLNLSGLGSTERIFTLVIAFAGFGIFLLSAIAERAKEFSTMRAIGAAPSQLRRLLAIEGGSIMVFGLLLSVPVGFIIARVLVTLLTSIFSLPVSGVSVSLSPLLILFAVSAGGLLVALVLTAQALPRLSLGTTLREE
ncbi:MAG: ABC transporter permease [Chloroflexota bacterium]|nr:ABC transporter permease [Chloroflexota bacterium]